MVIVRCIGCASTSMLRTKALNNSAEPVGYPDGAIVCGVAGCQEPGLVWLRGRDIIEHRTSRQLVFPLAAHNNAKVRVKPHMPRGGAAV
jgi:hypothetical protein